MWNIILGSSLISAIVSYFLNIVTEYRANIKRDEALLNNLTIKYLLLSVELFRYMSINNTNFSDEAKPCWEDSKEEFYSQREKVINKLHSVSSELLQCELEIGTVIYKLRKIKIKSSKETELLRKRFDKVNKINIEYSEENISIDEAEYKLNEERKSIILD